MIVTFKENYDVRVYDEDNCQSGIFTFMSSSSWLNNRLINCRSKMERETIE